MLFRRKSSFQYLAGARLPSRPLACVAGGPEKIRLIEHFPICPSCPQAPKGPDWLVFNHHFTATIFLLWLLKRKKKNQLSQLGWVISRDTAVFFHDPLVKVWGGHPGLFHPRISGAYHTQLRTSVMNLQEIESPADIELVSRSLLPAYHMLKPIRRHPETGVWRSGSNNCIPHS